MAIKGKTKNTTLSGPFPISNGKIVRKGQNRYFYHTNTRQLIFLAWYSHSIKSGAVKLVVLSPPQPS